MNRILNEKEIQSVIALPGPKRYEHWIKKVADQQQVWSLWQEGWALVSDKHGNELVPVWPHPKYAELCTHDQWQGYTPKSIDLDAWLTRWIPGMKRDSRSVAVFPTPQDKGVVVDPMRLEKDLREEMAQYE